MSTIKRSFLVVIVVCIVLTSFIFPASAASIDFYFNVPDPSTMSDGYIICPHSSGGAYMFWWTITPALENVSSAPNIVTTVNYNVSSVSFSFTISVSSANVPYYVTLYSIANGTNSNPVVVRSGLVNNTSNITYEYSWGATTTNLHPTAWAGIEQLNLNTNDSIDDNNFTYRYADNNAFYKQLTDINIYLISLLESSSLSSTAIQTLIDNTNSIITKLTSIDNNSSVTNEKLTSTITNLNTIITHFVDLLSKVDYTNEQLDDIVLKFADLLEVTNSISVDLSDFIYIYWDTFANYTFPENILAVINKLEQIRRLLTASGNVEQTTVSSDKVDEYVDIEQSLVNNEDAESAIADLDVSIDGDSYSFIWDLITSILNSHPEVFGLLITILTLGFLALILNR